MRAGIFTVKIEKVLEMGVQETRHFTLAFDPGTIFEFDAGQFVNVIVEKDGKPVKRAYSIASPPSRTGSIELCWRRVQCGTLTSILWNFKEGDRIQIQGPLGRFILPKPAPKNIVFISTGTGIAPFRSIIQDLLQKKVACEMVNLFGNRFEEDILYREEFETLAKEHSNLKNAFVISRPENWKGETGYVQSVLPKYVTNPAETHLYICGLNEMITDVVKTAEGLGLPKSQIHFERYN